MGRRALTQDEFKQRFWQKVDRSGKCWIWKGQRNSVGYGRALRLGKQPLAHRVAYELMHGPIPEGCVVMHRCDVKLCVHPDHLRLGTQRDNVLDSVRKGRKGKLSVKQVREIRARYAAGETQTALAREFPVDQTTISLLVLRKTYAVID